MFGKGSKLKNFSGQSYGPNGLGCKGWLINEVYEA